MLGKTIAHYKITAKLGEGGMGVVWRAQDTKLGRDVALKFLPDAFVSDPGRHARFRTEAQALAAFSHPHVGNVYALEDVDDQHFLVMELIPGVDLSERIKNGPLPQKIALEIASQIALALESAHAKNIIHRDLKPANVKINDENQIKILDFGLAKFYTDESNNSEVGSLPTVTSELTAIGAILGTAAYMSPEQARGQVADKRVDIWALGCVLFEMLTGKLVFPGETQSDVLAALLRAEPDWNALPADSSPGVLRLLRRCLQKNPRQRLHDVADVRIEIDDILTGQDLVPAPAPTSQSAHRWRPIALVIAGVCLALAGLLGRTWLNPAPTSSPISLRPISFSGRDWAPSASPDGQNIAFVSDRDGSQRIWLKQLASGNEAPLTEGRDDHPRYSPDGSQILFVRNNQTNRSLYRISVVGGSKRKLMDNVVEADWSPDGSEVVFVRVIPKEENSLAQIGIASVQTGAERIITSIENRLVYSVRWSPDGRYIALNGTSMTGNVVNTGSFNLIDPQTGETADFNIKNWQGANTGTAWSPDGKTLIVGQSPDLMDYISGYPSLVGQYNIQTGRSEDLFWDQFRLPRGGWGYSTIAVINDHEIVFDRYSQHSELRLISLHDGQPDGPAELLTTSLGRDRQPVYSPDGNTVVFSSNRSGNIDLWSLDLTTRQMQQLTDDPTHDWDPAFSPDGQSLLWSSSRSGNLEIWQANLDGSGARQVTQDGEDAENPTMTADGQWIIYASSNNTKVGIWKIRPDGSDAQMIAPGANLLPEVSPDGKLALFTVGSGLDAVISVIDLGTGKVVDFDITLRSFNSGVDIVMGRARWSSDSRNIIFVGLDENDRMGIFSQPFMPGEDTSADRVRLTTMSNFYDAESMGLSPDGNSLVFSAMYNRRVLMLAERLKLSNWE